MELSVIRRGGQRDREGETGDPRASDQLHENGRHKESLGDDQPAGEARGSTRGEERGDRWNSFEAVHGKIAFVFTLVGPLPFALIPRFVVRLFRDRLHLTRAGKVVRGNGIEPIKRRRRKSWREGNVAHCILSLEPRTNAVCNTCTVTDYRGMHRHFFSFVLYS